MESATVKPRVRNQSLLGEFTNAGENPVSETNSVHSELIDTCTLRVIRKVAVALIKYLCRFVLNIGLYNCSETLLASSSFTRHPAATTTNGLVRRLSATNL